MTKHRQDIRSMTTIALCIALLSAASYVIIPIPYSPAVLTVHTIIVNLTALILKPHHAFTAVFTYLVMGLAGLPVFSGGTAGPDKLFGPTGGFYFGFLVTAVIMSLICSGRHSLKLNIIAALIGLVIQHSFAVLFMSFYNGFNVVPAFVSVSLPFIVPDIFKAVLSAILALKLQKILLRKER